MKKCNFSESSYIWEIGIKQSIGKLTFNLLFEIFITQQIIINEFSLLEIKIQHINIVSQLPVHHRDPFDRMLIPQAITENLPILSADTIFDNYPIQRLW